MEKKYVEGTYAYKPRENAPDFVIADLVFKQYAIEEMLELAKQNGGEVRMQVKQWEDKYNLGLNNYKSQPSGDGREKPHTENYPTSDINPDDIPFS